MTMTGLGVHMAILKRTAVGYAMKESARRGEYEGPKENTTDTGEDRETVV